MGYQNIIFSSVSLSKATFNLWIKQSTLSDLLFVFSFQNAFAKETFQLLYIKKIYYLLKN